MKFSTMCGIQMSFIAGTLMTFLQDQSADVWERRDEVVWYVSRCIDAGFCRTPDDVRLCAQRYLAGKRRVTPPGTARRKRLVREQERLRATIPFQLRVAVQNAIFINDKAVRQYLDGNDRAVNALIGYVMREHKADATVIKELLIAAIKEL